jgi:transposase
MSKRYKEYQPDQMMLLPPSLGEWLPEGHLARFISDLVDEMDLSRVTQWYEDKKGLRGQPPYNPRMMVKVLFYALATGTFSSRQIARRLYDDVAFRYLSANTQPDFRTINNFRQRHREEMIHLFAQLVQVAVKAGIATLRHVSIDGTKLKANASKHKAMSYERLKEEREKLEAEIRELLAKAEAIDRQEDEEFGPDRQDDLPSELAFREKRLAKIQEAIAALEAEAKADEERTSRSDDHSDTDKPTPPSDQPPAMPEPKAQRNFTDPESRIMLSADKAFIQGYNGQLSVDSDNQIIVGVAVTNQANDKGLLTPMVEMTRELGGRTPDTVLADAGYFSRIELQELEDSGIDVLVPPDKMRHGRKPDPAPRGRIPASLSYPDRMRRKLRTKRGRELYAKRMKTVEPVFGQIKRGLRFTQFLTRGLKNVNVEWICVSIGHNLRKLALFSSHVLDTMRGIQVATTWA